MLLLAAGLLSAAAGCHPTQPFYVGRDGDLEHYLSAATQIDYPDVHAEPLPDVLHAESPLTLSSLDFDKMWDLTLEQCVAMGLQNSKVIRREALITTPNFEDTVLSRPESVGTVFDPAIVESDPLRGSTP